MDTISFVCLLALLYLFFTMCSMFILTFFLIKFIISVFKRVDSTVNKDLEEQE